MFYWTSFPFVRLIIPFIAGIVLSQYYEVEGFMYYAQIVFFTLFVVFLLNHKYVTSFSNRWIPGVLIYLLLILSGYGIAYSNQQYFEPPQVNENEPVSWIGKIQDVVKKDSGVKQIQVLIERLQQKDSWQKTHFKLLVYNSNTKINPTVGDYISGTGNLQKPQKSLNPEQFNYKAFLQRKLIYYISYEDEYIFKQGGISFWKYAFLAREKIQETYQSIGLSGDELAVAIALTLGDKSKLNYRIKQNYAGVGAMHILAVSGLHVGIVFFIFSFLLSVLPNKKKFNYLKAIILVLVVWSFAFLAGFSPSVQRASWMFSFVIISNAMEKNVHVLNSIAASAFLLLVINPNTLFQLGFHLSYSAVIGIVLLHPPLYRLFISKFTLLNKVWSLIVVSFVAQLATLPFALYYFHQFPSYFLLTNLFVIPLAFCIVSLAIFIVPFYLVSGVDYFFGDLLDKLLQVLNYGINTISELPYSVSTEIWIHPMSFVLLFFVVALFIYFVQVNRKHSLLSCFGLLFAIISLETYLNYSQLKRKQMMVYATGKPALSVVCGLKAIAFTSEKLNDYDRKVVNDHLSSIGVKKVEWKSIVDGTKNGIIQLDTFTVLLNPTQEYLKQKNNIPDLIIAKDYFSKDIPSSSKLISYDYFNKDSKEQNQVYYLKKEGYYSIEF